MLPLALLALLSLPLHRLCLGLLSLVTLPVGLLPLSLALLLRCLRHAIGGFGFALRIAQAILGPAVSHQVTQFAHAQGTDFVHAYQHGSSDRKAAMADFADDGRRHFKGTRQSRIVFQVKPLNQDIQEMVGIIGFLGD